MALTNRKCCSPHRSIVIYTHISVVLCLAILALSLVDLGRASLGTNIALPILTIGYHAVIVIAYRRLRKAANEGRLPEDFLHPAATTASLVCVYSLIVLWYLPFALINGLDTNFTHNKFYNDFFAGSRVTVGVQMGLDSSESGMLISVAIVSTIMRVIADRRAKAEAAGQSIAPAEKC